METNPDPRRPVPTVCRLLCSNVRGLAGNLGDLTVASSRYDILLCSETLLSDMRHVSEMLVLGFGRLIFSCAGSGFHEPEGWRHTYEMDMEHFASPCLSVVVWKCWILWFVVRDRVYMCSVFTATSPDLDDRINLMFTNINGC